MGYRTRRMLSRANYFASPRKRKFRLSLFLLIVFLLLGSTIFILQTMIRPPIVSIATAKLNKMALQIVNNSILEELKKEDIKYEDLIQIQRDDAGNVKSINSDIFIINYAKANFAQAITKNIADVQEAEISVPIGNLTGIDLFVGRGYKIPVKIVPAGYVNVDFKSEFTSAGINQTKHEVVAQVDVKMSAIMPMGLVDTQMTTSIPLVQTVIVGEVPESLTEIIGAGAERYVPYVINQE